MENNENGVGKKVGLATILEAAEFLSLSKNKVYEAVKAGEIPAKRFGKSVRIPWAWLQQQAEYKGE